MEDEQKGTLPAIQSGNETILLAEDEEVLRELAREVLEGLGYRILLAVDGAEAVEMYATNRHQIDAVMLDMVMPRMSGHEAYERIHSLNSDVPVIFTTGYSVEIVQDTFINRNPFSEESAAVVIEKPYSIESLEYKLREVLDSPPVRH